ncbi:MAG: hypothetical protein BWX84_00525 [Verrucomicrobia bacterium ADurb.Bin118]|jgi:hypothetical protein|nr:MAG: hypothetical protein BWX84_00525 [Verrucomicrobia bacterium ADurb.Bin118]
MPIPSPPPAVSTERVRLVVCSDIHYASAAEQARGEHQELAMITNPLLRIALRSFRHWIWLRHPLRQNGLLDEFLRRVPDFDYGIANGDYAADMAFLGVSDPATFAGAQTCLTRLRARFGERFRATLGDHELGKLSFFGHYGGLRLASWHRAHAELGLEGCWQLDLGCYTLLGVTSTLLALPAFAADMLETERADWQRLRAEHLTRIREILTGLAPDRRLILFCHDPTALPFLGQEPAMRARWPQLELTVIGHLHSPLVLWKSRLLSGMPQLTCLGATVARMSGALRRAREWRPFRVRLCPSLAGLQVERGGGWGSLTLDPAGRAPLEWHLHRLRRAAAA